MPPHYCNCRNCKKEGDEAEKGRSLESELELRVNQARARLDRFISTSSVSGQEELRLRAVIHKFLDKLTIQELPKLMFPATTPPSRIYPPPCDCQMICCYQFRLADLQEDPKQAYKKKLTDSEARDVAARSLEKIQESFEFLRRVYGVNERVICARWRKKSRDWREACLFDASGELEIGRKMWKEAEFMATPCGVASLGEKTRTERTAWLLPWLNVESLKNDPMKLIGLLQNRTTFSPKEWAVFDNANLNFAYNHGFLAIDYSTLCVMMHGDYGKLVPWNKEAAHRLDIIGFPRGQLILAAQETLLCFLCNIVGKLSVGLREISQSVDDHNSTFEIPKREQKRLGRTELWSPYLNQPFSQPPKFDIDYIISVAKSKVDSFGDHLWLMQTDPAYLRRTIRTLISAIPAKENEISSEQIAYFTAVNEIDMDYGLYTTWVWIREEAEGVRDLRIKYHDQIKEGSPLPLEYDLALKALEILVRYQIECREDVFKRSIPIRSGFRDLFRFDYSTGDVRWGLKFGVAENALWDSMIYTEDPLWWCVSNMYSHPPERLKFEPSMLFSFLDEYLITAPMEQKRRIDERLYAQLSDYAAVNEILSIIQLHRPGLGQLSAPEIIEAWDNSCKPHRFCRPNRPEDLASASPEQHAASQARERDNYAKIVPSLIDFIHAYDEESEVGKKSDQSRLKRFDNIHRAQEVLWTKFRAMHETSSFHFMKASKEDFEKGIAPISARQDPKFIEALKKERQELVDNIERSSSQPARNHDDIPAPWQLFSSDQKTGSHSGTKVSSSIPPTTKIKRRPETSTSLDNNLDDTSLAPSSSEDSEQEYAESSFIPIQVKQQTYIILTSMFNSTDTAAESKKTIDWDAFVNAMADVGFSARHNGGSAVIFEIDDSTLNWVGKIVFHKPHPVTKIDSVVFRGMGRRMEKWFGWNKGTFALKM